MSGPFVSPVSNATTHFDTNKISQTQSIHWIDMTALLFLCLWHGSHSYGLSNIDMCDQYQKAKQSFRTTKICVERIRAKTRQTTNSSGPLPWQHIVLNQSPDDSIQDRLHGSICEPSASATGRSCHILQFPERTNQMTNDDWNTLSTSIWKLL